MKLMASLRIPFIVTPQCYRLVPQRVWVINFMKLRAINFMELRVVLVKLRVIDDVKGFQGFIYIN